MVLFPFVLIRELVGWVRLVFVKLKIVLMLNVVDLLLLLKVFVELFIKDN